MAITRQLVARCDGCLVPARLLLRDDVHTLSCYCHNEISLKIIKEEIATNCHCKIFSHVKNKYSPILPLMLSAVSCLCRISARKFHLMMVDI